MIRILVVLAALLTALSLHAEPVRLDSAHQRILLGEHGSIFIDSTQSATIDHLRSPEGARLFHQSNEPIPNYLIADRIYWFRFEVVQATSELPWSLSVNNPSLKRIDVYLIDSGGASSHFVLGTTVPYSHRIYKSRFFSLPLELKQDVHYTLYLRIDGGDLGHFFPIYFESLPNLSKRMADDSLFYGIYTGLMLFMTVLSCFFLFSTRDTTYFYYALSVLSAWILNLTIDGVTFQYLFTDRSAPITYGYLIGIVFYQTSGILFARSYLATSTFVPKLDKVFIAFIGLAVVLPFISLFDIYSAVNATVVTTFLLYFLMIFAAVMAMRRKHRPAGFFVVALLVNLGGAVAITLYYHGQLSFAAAYAGIMGTALQVIILSLGLADQLKVTRREKEEVQRQALEEQTALANAFSRFVPREMLAFLGREHIRDVSLGDAIQQEMTIMFSDVRAFTTISEQLSAQECFLFLNEYLSHVSPIIRHHGGFIDKYIGDAILAVFPDSVETSINCAIDMICSLRAFNSSPRTFDIPVHIGIGIHTGPTMLGTIGEPQRFDSTVIADVVNFSSRLEGLTKYYNIGLLVSADVIKCIEHSERYHWRYVDKVVVKGSLHRVDIFEIFDGEPPEVVALKKETEPMMTRAIHAYHEGNFQESLALVIQVHQRSPNDPLVLLYKGRLEYCINHNVAPDTVTATYFEQK